MPKPRGQTNVDSPTKVHSIFTSKWFLGCLGTLTLVLALGVLTPWLYFAGRHQRALAAVQAEVARIQKAGEPITTEDMVALHRVPEGVFDSTPLWLDALESAEKIETGNESQLPFVGDGELTDLSADSPKSLLPLAKEFLAAHAETIEKSRKAAAAGGQCRYPMKFAEGHLDIIQHTMDARVLMRVLSMRLHVAVETRDIPTAIESLELELALAGTLDRELNLISQLVQMSLSGWAVQDVRSLVSELPLSEDELADLQQRIAAIDFQRMVKDGMIGERVGGFHMFHYPDEQKMLAGENRRLTRPVDLQIYLGFMREMIEAGDQPVELAHVTAKQLEDKLKREIAARGPHGPRDSALTQQLTPALGGIFEASARNQAIRDAAAAGIAFRRYQLKHGSAPQSLESLVPEFLPAVPRDPFATGGGPLKLVIHDGKYFIYSIGANLKDDQALLRDPTSFDDVGFVAKLAVPGKESSPSAAPPDSE
ncbi:MAG TPA: hypothetical protein VMP01_23940 [Pirellulaceae bacterium]|nr:hypothetical protein [Pirellulaceae bacterium]